MDPRIREHAAIIVDHCTGVEAGDDVVITAPSHAEDLEVALYEELGDRGANPLSLGASSRAMRGYLRAADPAEFELPGHKMALYEEMDVFIAVRGDRNATETGDVEPDVLSAHRRAERPALDERLSKRWLLTQFPSPGNAQLAEMSSEGYENFVWDAVNKDWDAQRDHQAQLVELLDGAEAVRVVSGDATDITLPIHGNPPVNDSAQHNLPGGEVFTAPVPDAVEGEVHFDMPLYHQGREVLDVRLVFEEGEVVEHEAGKNEDVLTSVLETDENARRLGELGIGMNRDIDRFTYNMLFDEKMGDTVHMALGRAYEDTVAEGNERNDSAVHVDMIVDMAEDSRIEVDGEVVQRNGRFVFEDGFEAP